MRPKTKVVELPSTYNLTVHIYNEFAKYLDKLKESFKVN